MSYRDDWLKNLAFHETKKGVRVDLFFYVYPDGHGNLHYTTGAGEDANLPVPNPEHALDVFRAIWEGARAHERTGAAPAEEEM
jgi:hypothetical protein